MHAGMDHLGDLLRNRVQGVGVDPELVTADASLPGELQEDTLVAGLGVGHGSIPIAN